MLQTPTTTQIVLPSLLTFLLAVSNSPAVVVQAFTSNTNQLRHTKRITRPFHLSAKVNIRDWQTNEHENIYNFLSQQKQLSSKSFDPEGSLDLDVLDEFSIKESYSNDDGGCFLVAVIDNDGEEEIVGTLGMISGTKVMYQSSGSSLSDAQVTAAIRRVCASRSNEGEISEKIILKELISEGEKRAMQSGATSIIGLAYPDVTIKDLDGIDCIRIVKPNAEIFESLGFKQPSNDQLSGVETIQFEKMLIQNQPPLQQDSLLIPVTIATLLSVGFLLFNLYTNVFGIEQLWGSSDNAGIGTSLSTQNLEELIQNEKLGRSDLDDGVNSGMMRQWGDLSPEEVREEQALMKVIQGQSIRSK